MKKDIDDPFKDLMETISPRKKESSGRNFTSGKSLPESPSLQKKVENFSNFYIAQRGRNDAPNKHSTSKDLEEKLKSMNGLIISREDKNRLSTLKKMAIKIEEERKTILMRVLKENSRHEALAKQKRQESKMKERQSEKDKLDKKAIANRASRLISCGNLTPLDSTELLKKMSSMWRGNLSLITADNFVSSLYQKLENSTNSSNSKTKTPKAHSKEDFFLGETSESVIQKKISQLSLKTSENKDKNSQNKDKNNINKAKNSQNKDKNNINKAKNSQNKDKNNINKAKNSQNKDKNNINKAKNSQNKDKNAEKDLYDRKNANEKQKNIEISNRVDRFFEDNNSDNNSDDNSDNNSDKNVDNNSDNNSDNNNIKNQLENESENELENELEIKNIQNEMIEDTEKNNYNSNLDESFESSIYDSENTYSDREISDEIDYYEENIKVQTDNENHIEEIDIDEIDCDEIDRDEIDIDEIEGKESSRFTEKREGRFSNSVETPFDSEDDDEGRTKVNVEALGRILKHSLDKSSIIDDENSHESKAESEETMGCKRCTFIFPLKLRKCPICRAPKDYIEPKKWACVQCGFSKNEYFVKQCTLCEYSLRAEDVF